MAILDCVYERALPLGRWRLHRSNTALAGATTAVGQKPRDAVIGLIVVGAALMATLVTFLPILAVKYPALGLPPYESATGTGVWQMHVLRLAVFIVIAWLIGKRDLWLGAAVVFAGLVLFWRGATIIAQGADIFALSALLVVATRSIPTSYHGPIQKAIVAAGVLQALYVIFEMHFQYDPLFDMGSTWGIPWHPWTPTDGPVVLPIQPYAIRPLGTLARVDASMAWIAVTGPLWPMWLLPVAAYALWQGFSIGACAAFAVGVGLRLILLRNWRGMASLGAGAVFFLGVVMYLKGLATPVIQGRIAIWQYAAGLWNDPILIWCDRVFGWGLGNWARVVPALQERDRFKPSGEVFVQAHNEYVQWTMETGLVGVILLIGWLWTNRSIFAHRLWGGSLAALGINSLTFFPFHVPALGLLGVSLIGLALSTEVAHG